jgi:hypothetical protein
MEGPAPTEAHKLLCADRKTLLLEQVRSVWVVRRGVEVALWAYGLAVAAVALVWLPDAGVPAAAIAAWATATPLLLLLRTVEDILCDFDDEVAPRSCGGARAHVVADTLCGDPRGRRSGIAAQ